LKDLHGMKILYVFELIIESPPIKNYYNLVSDYHVLTNNSSEKTLRNDLFEDFVKNNFNNSVEKLPTLLNSRFKFMQI
jgi:hypothetical protein